MVRILTFNANGIRSAARKGFFDWLPGADADVVCIQETRAAPEQLQDPVFYPEGYQCRYFAAQRKGYAGTAVYCRLEPQAIHSGLGWEPADSEGRWLEAEYPKISVGCLYMPSGTSGEERQQIKFRFLDRFQKDLQMFRRRRREYIICADWNICHKEIDLENWRSNQKNSGFLPEERAWIDALLTEHGWSDAFRLVNPHPKQYTWWSNRGRARENNVGWRLDYQLISPGLRSQVRDAVIHREFDFSDHAPLSMDYDIAL